MKIEKIVIKNLNSIEYAEIDFSNEIISSEPLFLICGETGSGKSTILDAITLALYDKASRYESVNNKEKMENGITTKNAINIFRKGTDEAKSELYFSVNENKYIATWYVRKKRTGKYDADNRRKLELIVGEGKVVLFDKVEAVNDKIKDLVGLSYEQFVRSVMLAQGEFSTFLKSKKSEQSEILEMLTGTEVYSKIAESVKSKRSLASSERDKSESIFNSLKDKVLSQEEITELKTKKEQLSQNIAQKDSESNRIECSISWIKKNAELHEELEVIKQLYDKVQGQVNSQVYKENQSVVNDYFRTEESREALKELRVLENELISINDNYKNNVRSFLNLKNSLQSAKDNKLRLVQQVDDMRLWIENHADNGIISENLNLILGGLNELTQISASLYSREKELRDNAAIKTGLLSQLDALLNDLEKARITRHDAEKYLEDLLKDFNSDEHKTLVEKQNQLIQERKSSSDRITQLSNVRIVLEQYIKLYQNIENEKNKYNDLKLLLNQKNESVQQHKSVFDVKDSEFQVQKNMVENWAKEYRLKLKDGEPCPVCGSKNHSYKDEEVVQSLFSQIEKEWKNLKISYENAKDELNKIEAETKALCNTIISDEKRIADLLNKLSNLCGGEPYFDIDKIDAHINNHKKKISEIDNQLNEISVKLNNIAVVTKKIEVAQTNKKSLDVKYDLLEKQLKSKQNDYQKLELSFNTIQTMIQEQKVKLDEKECCLNNYINIGGWKQTFIKSPNDFIKFINKIATEWNEKNDLLKRTENQIDNLDIVIKQSDVFVENITSLIPDEKFDFEKKMIDAGDLVSLFSAVYEKIRDRLSEKSRRQEDIRKNTQIIEVFINNNPDFTTERLKFLSDIDVQIYIQKNKDIDNELIKVKQTFIIKTEEKESHQNSESRPNEDVTIEGLELKLESLKQDKKLLEEDLNNVNARLSLDSQNASDLMVYKKDYDEKDRIYCLWDQLAKAIGTSDGKNFRDVAQTYTMGILLDRANFYLKQLSNRYLLSCFEDSLAIMVRDLEMGSELRAASSLSGGETFLVSLALALGLTSLNDKHFNIDMLFIDEGFGTLDNESLDMVMNTLENLHNLGRKVGIISHVEALKERIPAKIQLVREGKSASRVEIIRS